MGEVEAAGENRSDGGITRVVRGVLEGRGRRKDGFALGRSIEGRAVMSLRWITGSRGNIEATLRG